MALTVVCADCHDHKFDPIKQKDFYSLSWFFNNNNEKAMDGNALLTPPTLKLPSAEDQKQIADLDGQMAGVKTEISNTLEKVEYKDLAPHELKRVDEPQEIVFIDDE